MLVRIKGVLTSAQVQDCRRVLADAAWVDGRVTTGRQSARAKRNLQVPSDAPQVHELGQMILKALGQTPAFVSAALPLRVLPPMFNRYDKGMQFGGHVDNAIRSAPGGGRVRTDLSCTLFLTPPEDYDGGELVIEAAEGEQRVKFDAGDLALYPATSVHRVEKITRGSRWASFFWVQSMVKDEHQLSILHRLDTAIQAVRLSMGEAAPAALTLTATYHNLLRMWAEV